MKMTVNDKSVDAFIKNYLDNLPNGWTTQLDMTIAMKNSMIEVLSNPSKYSYYESSKTTR